MDSSPYSCTSKLRHIGSIFVPISRVRPIYLKAVTGSRDPTTCWKLVDKCSKAQEMGCIHEVYYIYALIYRFMATNVWPEVQKYRDEINNRFSEAGDTRKELIYTNIQLMYTKTEIWLKTKICSEIGPRRGPNFISSFTPLISLIML